MKSTLKFPLILLVLVNFGASCHQEPVIPWDTLRDTAERYLQKFCSRKERDEMHSKLAQRMQQKIDDSDMDEDRAMREVMLEWAVGNAGKLMRKEQKAVAQACFYFLTFIDKGYLMPNLIRAQLTPRVTGDILAFLDKQIVAKK